MDKKRGILNVSVSIFFKIILLFVSIMARRYLIQYVGNEANGLNSLYISIIGFLSVAELGVGTAITFCMYKPIVEGEKQKVSALYHLFTRFYLIIGGIILVGGLILMPFLPYLAADYADIDINLYLTFGLMLVSTVISYLFSSKTSLINAYKNNYITTTINSLGLILQYVLQIVMVIYTQSFVWYLVCHIIGIAFQWILTEIIAHFRYKAIIKDKQKVDVETRKEVTKNVKAMFMHKIGATLSSTADSVIISAFIGVVILGKYSNYTTIMTSLTALISLLFTPLISIIGHFYVDHDLVNFNKYFNFFYTFSFIVNVIFFMGYYAIIDNLVTIFFGNELELDKSISMVITINYFISMMRQASVLFRDATGTFYYDRWRPLIEGIINIILSIAFVLWFGIIGVLVATIITNLLICHVVEPYVLFKHTLKAPVRKYYIRNYSCFVLFVVALFALHFCMQEYDNQWIELLVNGFISVGISIILCSIAIISDKDFRHYVKKIFEKVKHKMKRKKTDTIAE